MANAAVDQLDHDASVADQNATAVAASAKAKRLSPAIWLSVGWLSMVSAGAVFAPWLGLPDPGDIDFLNLQMPPNGEYWLGTDVLGRDILTRLIYGARVSLTVGFIAPAIGMVFGLLLGLLAGYYRGRVEALIVASMDVVLAVPALVLLFLFSAIFGGSLPTVSIGLGLLFIPAFARVSRASTLVFAEREFMLAARAMGAGDIYVIAREILPNVVLPVLAFALVAVATAIVVEGALSFLGLSVPSPEPSWGGMIAEGREHLQETPHISLIPAGVMFLTVLAFNLVGDTMRSRIADVRESAL